MSAIVESACLVGFKLLGAAIPEEGRDCLTMILAGGCRSMSGTGVPYLMVIHFTSRGSSWMKFVERSFAIWAKLRYAKAF